LPLCEAPASPARASLTERGAQIAVHNCGERTEMAVTIRVDYDRAERR